MGACDEHESALSLLDHLCGRLFCRSDAHLGREMSTLTNDGVSAAGDTLKEIRILSLTDLGFFSTVRGKRVFFPFFLIVSPRPVLKAGEVVELVVPRWFLLEQGLVE